jgi:hypothetical protein
MIKKTDWQAAYHDLMAEGRQRLGEPPTASEVEAYLKGDLEAEDAVRVREFLVYYPELADALEAPFPFPYEGKSGDADFLSAEEMARDWAGLQAGASLQHATVASPRSAGAPSSQLLASGAPGWSRRLWGWTREVRPLQLSAVAASLLAVVLGGLLLRSQRDVQHLQHELMEPRVNLEHRLLLPDGQRGGTSAEQPAIPLPPEAEYFLLIPALVNARPYPSYEISIFDLSTTPPRRIWSREGLRRRSDDTFEVWVPRTFLKPGRYRLVAYGLAGDRQEQLASYTVRLAPE